MEESKSGFSKPSSTSLLKVQEKASLLVEALPYMQRFAGERIVVKFGGHAMKSPQIQASFARDVTLLRSIGINVTVVHGGGPQIANLLEQMSIESRFVEGMRVTDDETMKAVQMVLMGQVNPMLVQLINAAGGRSIGLSGVDGQLLQAQRLSPNGIDIGRVGEVSRVDDSELRLLGEAGFINSTIGFNPPKAAPTPKPVNPCSVIGVSITLFSPNSSSKP